MPIAAFSQQPHPPAWQGSLSGQGGAGLGWAGLGEQRCSPRVEWALDPALQGHIHLSQRTGERGSKTQTGFASSAELMAIWRAGPLAGTCPVHQPPAGTAPPAWLAEGHRWKSDGLVATPLPHLYRLHPFPTTSIPRLTSIQHLLDTTYGATVFNAFISLTPHSSF